VIARLPRSALAALSHGGARDGPPLRSGGQEGSLSAMGGKENEAFCAEQPRGHEPFVPTPFWNDRSPTGSSGMPTRLRGCGEAWVGRAEIRAIGV